MFFQCTPERQSLCESHRRRRWLTCWSYSLALGLQLRQARQALHPSLTVARYMILKLFISAGYRWYSMYLGCLFCLFVYVKFFRILLQ